MLKLKTNWTYEEKCPVEGKSYEMADKGKGRTHDVLDGNKVIGKASLCDFSGSCERACIDQGYYFVVDTTVNGIKKTLSAMNQLRKIN